LKKQKEILKKYNIKDAMSDDLKQGEKLASK